MGIAVLGPLDVDGDTVGLGPRDRVVLAALAVRPGEAVSAERLADALWADAPPASSAKVVQGCVVRLRKVLGRRAIETTPRGYRLAVPAEEVDAQRFERLVGRSRELLTLGEPERAAHVVGEALALWRGRALVELEAWDPGRIEAERLEELRLDAEELRVDAALRAGRCREVLPEAQTLAAAAPLRERRWELLALAQYQAGRQGEALRTLHRARTVLAGELGLEPGPDLVGLEAAILRQDPSLAAEGALPEPSATCPYLGLIPYGVDDADGFFGRDADVAACVHRLAETGVLAVVGPSGSGKSSLVRAGVAAALQRDRRPVVVVTPGPRPTDALSALPDTGPPPALVVDQCEEAVTLCDDGDEQARFFAGLAAHAERAPLVVALRADRLGELSAHPGFARLIEPGVYLLGAMSEADLRAAIEGPARQAALLLEPGLVELLVREVEGEPGALPLLSHALRMTWQRREGRTLTVAGYRSTGGIRGAVAQSAEDLYHHVPTDQRTTLRDLMLRLVSPSPGGDPVRHRVPRRIAAADPARERLVEQLVAARLVSSDDGVVELAHEALATAWPRLRGWLDDDTAGQRILRHLAVAADTWEAMGRPDSEVYRGVRLAQALDWQERARPDLTHTERDFLAEAEHLAEAEQQSAEERAQHQARINRRLRALLAGVGVLLVTALVAGFAAVGQRENARDSAAEARAAATVAEARRISTQALTVDYLDRSLLLAVEGHRLHDSNDTRANLLAALNRSPEAVRIVSRADRPQQLIVTSDGRYVALSDNNGGVSFYDTAGVEQVAEVADTSTSVNTIAAVPGGGDVAAAIWSWDDRRGAVRFLDPATGHETRAPLQGVTEGTGSLAISDDGRYVAAAGDGALTIWDLTAPTSPPRRMSLGPEPPALAFTPGGDLVIAGIGALPGLGALSLIDPATGTERWSDPDLHWPVAVSRDGKTLAAVTGDARATIALADLATGARRRSLTGHGGPVEDLAFSPSGRSLASASDDHTVVVWDPATGVKDAVLAGHSSWVTQVAYGVDDATLYSSAYDGMMISWDLGGDRRFLHQAAPADRPPPCRVVNACTTYVVPNPDRSALEYYEGRSRLGGDTFTVRDMRSLRFGDERSSGHGRVGKSAWTPDGRRLVTVGADGVRLWDPVTGRKLAERRLPPGSTDGSIGWRPGSDSLALGLDNAGVVELDADTLAPVGEPLSFARRVSNVDVSPDDRLLAVALEEPNAVVLVDRATHEVVATFDGLDGESQLAFSPDGSLLAAGGYDGRFGLVDPVARRRVGSSIRASDSPVASLDFSPDGTRIVTTSHGDVSLWDATAGQRIGRMTLGSNFETVFAWFADDGGTVVIADQRGGIWTFPTDPGEWQRQACHIVGRNLTHEEWHELVPGRPYHRTCPEYPAPT